MQGVWAAVLTPVDDAFAPIARLAIPYYAELLELGCDGLNVLGTTGEAMSLSSEQRLRYMAEIAGSGLPLSRLMVGTGSAALEDSVRLTKAAFDLGFAAALIMPPFFFRDVSHDGIVNYFDGLLSRAGATSGRVVLYNFPAMSGVTFVPELVDALVERLPVAIVGIKDSSNDRSLQQAIARSHPEIAVFPSSEEWIHDATARYAGCISGSVALWPRLAKDVFEGRDGSAAQRLIALRRAVAGPEMLARVRYLTAKARDEATWKRPVPPLSPLSEDRAVALEQALSRCV
ncbi:MAG TPA: dihydrodipicolinate synthase family protein [Candidatus Baltobacteraceae bacterium]|nr:dihydrodipicolinate synthase family protein [Candidatus Baltobacteraceae bacterium]